MKIAYILSSLSNSGPILVAYDLVKLMVEHGHIVKVYYFVDKVNLDFPCPTERITMSSCIAVEHYDVIHCHGLRPDLYMLLHNPLWHKVPVCSTIHSYMFRDHAYTYGKYRSYLTTLFVLASTLRDDKVILLSKDMKEYYKPYLPKRKLTYAYNTRICDSSKHLTPSEKEELLTFKGNSELLCSVSGLNSRKGLSQIIKALPLLPNVKYCMVGDGAERQRLEQQAKALGVSDRVLFVGAKPAGYRYLPYADIFVMPSYSEGFPLAMLEAACFSKTVVCSDLPIFREVFNDDEIVVHTLDDNVSLVEAIRKAMTNKTTLGNAIHKRYIECYSPECFYQRHIEIYEGLINKIQK